MSVISMSSVLLTANLFLYSVAIIPTSSNFLYFAPKFSVPSLNVKKFATGSLALIVTVLL